MIVYVESNFVLELVRLQEESAPCEALITLAEQDSIELALPAYALVEPYETLRRNHIERSDLREPLKRQLDLIRRSQPLTRGTPGQVDVVALLTRATDIERAPSIGPASGS